MAAKKYDTFAGNRILPMQKSPAERETVLWSSTVDRHIREGLRFAADLPCKRSNCGTVCLCGSCHARTAISVLDPEFRPRYSKNWTPPSAPVNS